MTHPTLPESPAARMPVRDHLPGEHATMPLLDRAAASLALLAGSMLLADIVVITVLDASWGTVDNLLWSGSVALTPLALVLTSIALTRGVRRRWLAAPGVLLLSVAEPALGVPAVLLGSIVGLIPPPWGCYLLILVWLAWIGLAGARLRRLA